MGGEFERSGDQTLHIFGRDHDVCTELGECGCDSETNSAATAGNYCDGAGEGRLCSWGHQRFLQKGISQTVAGSI